MNLSKNINNKFFKLISLASKELGVKSYVIGGYVRDLILQRPSNDIDIVTVGSGIALAKKVAEHLPGHKEVKYYGQFGTAMIHFEGVEIEFVGARKESYDRSSRKPTVENGTLEDDQNRRDFTINALAISLNEEDWGELLDPFDGLEDLRDMIIRTPLDPDVTFSDDPLRMMRAVRFASQLYFDIDNQSFESITRNAKRLEIVSMERITDELNKIMLSPKPSYGLTLMEKSGLMKYVLPQVSALKGVEIVKGKGHKDNFLHTLEVVDNVAKQSPKLMLRWAALLHDIAKPQTKRFDANIGWTFYGHEIKGSKMASQIFNNLHLPHGEELKYVQKLISLHLRPIALTEDVVTDSAVRRLLFDAGDDIDDLMILCDADITSKNPIKQEKFHENFVLVRKKLQELEEKDHFRNWQPPLSGETIMEVFAIPASQKVGIIKTAIREAILDGVIGNNYAEAYAFMLEKGAKMGLHEVKKCSQEEQVKLNGPVPQKNNHE